MATTTETGQRSARPSIIQYLDEEIADYEGKVKEFRAGEIPEDEFMSFRLRLGVYGQRQPDAQMFRVKIPGGLAHADQWDAIGQIAERWAPLRKGHITTRENVQLHHLKLEDAALAMHLLQSVGLSTKEACGNSVRNITACPLAGIDPKQAFDIVPYMGAFARNFVRRDFTFHMPRKVKPAFSCGDHDCATVGMHDIGFVARVREIDGEQVKGFKITVGGGTSIQPLIAETIYEFVPVDEFLRVSEAMLRVFNRTAWLRRNKMKARIKVLIHTEGIDSFRQQVEEELQQDWAQDYEDKDYLLFHDDEEADIPALPTGIEPRGEDDAAFQAWKETNVIPQEADGYSVVGVTVTRGDLSPEQYYGTAEISRKYGSYRIRTTPEQNMMFRWVPNAFLYDVYKELEALDLHEGGLNQITDVTSCPGTDSCKLGITSSMGLNKAVADAVRNPNGHTGLMEDPLIKQMHIKMSGCPNGCGRHHVSDIGFHGAFIKGPGGGQIPAYEVFLGGSHENADMRFGVRPRGKIPAKKVTEAVFHLLRYYKDNREDGELFKDFAHRLGREPFEEIIKEYQDVGPLNKANLEHYIDYDKSVLYVMERGEGECAT